MLKNTLISITIPTYNRAEFLDECLAIHIPLVEKFKIQIFVCDNSSTDNTRLIVEKRMLDYPLIVYSCNEENLGPDKNFELALKKPQTEYVWLIGDTYRIPSDAIKYFIEKIQGGNKYDALIVNFANRASDINNRDYSRNNELLSDLGWHMTCMACLIYSKELVIGANFQRYRNTNFLQVGIIFEYIECKEFRIHWKKDISIQNITVEGKKKISWQDRTFEIWTKKWSNFVFSLPPSYELDVKMKCIMDHGNKSGLFSIRNMLILRSINALNFNVVNRYSSYFSLTIKQPLFLVEAISLFPIWILQGIKIILKRIKNKS